MMMSTVLPTEINSLTLEIDPNECLDQIIECFKERYIFHHRQDKSYRCSALACDISRSMIKKIADNLEMSNYRTERP